MSYRDETDALRARVDRLEGELGAAEQTIARLTGRAAPSVESKLTHSRLLGAPTGITIERELPFVIGEEGYEAIAAVVRARLGVQVSQVGRSLTTPGEVFTLTREGGSTRATIRASWTVLELGAPVSGGLAALFASMTTGALLSDIVHASPGMILANVAWVAPLVGGSVALLLRSRAQRAAAKYVKDHEGLMEAVLELAEAHAVRGPPIRARVESAPAEPEHQELEHEELEHEELEHEELEHEEPVTSSPDEIER